MGRGGGEGGRRGGGEGEEGGESGSGRGGEERVVQLAWPLVKNLCLPISVSSVFVLIRKQTCIYDADGTWI